MKKISLLILIFCFQNIFAQVLQDSVIKIDANNVLYKPLVVNNTILMHPDMSGVMDSIQKNGMLYKLSYRTGFVELTKTKIQEDKSTEVDTVFIANFFTLSMANGGGIYGSGKMKFISDNLYFTVDAGQGFGGKVRGLFKWNHQTNKVTNFIFLDEFYNDDKKRLKKKFKLKTKQITTFNPANTILLDQLKYHLDLWEEREKTKENTSSYDRKKYKSELKEYNFLKKHSEEPYYLYDEKPKYNLQEKNIFKSDNQHKEDTLIFSNYYMYREVDTLLLQNADEHINKVLNKFGKHQKYNVKVLDYFVTHRTGFNGIYFFYKENESAEVKVIRYDVHYKAWLMSNYTEIESKEKQLWFKSSE